MEGLLLADGGPGKPFPSSPDPNQVQAALVTENDTAEDVRAIEPVDDPSVKFRYFKRLPLELRQKIWRESLPGPRYVNLSITSTFREGNDSGICIGPITLHICQESREEALRFYKQLLPSSTGFLQDSPAISTADDQFWNEEYIYYHKSHLWERVGEFFSIYIDPTVDTLVLAVTSLYDWSASPMRWLLEVCRLNPETVGQVENLKVVYAREVRTDWEYPDNHDSLQNQTFENAESFFGHFLNLKRIQVGLEPRSSHKSSSAQQYEDTKVLVTKLEQVMDRLGKNSEFNVPEVLLIPFQESKLTYEKYRRR